MGFLFVLLVANLLTIIGSVVTGYEAHEVAAYLALNFSVVAALLGLYAMNGAQALYNMITAGKPVVRGENDDRKIE